MRHLNVAARLAHDDDSEIALRDCLMVMSL